MQLSLSILDDSLIISTEASNATLSVTPELTHSLQQYSDTYQSLHNSHNQDTLLGLGQALFDTINIASDVIEPWINSTGSRQLTLSASSSPSDLQLLLLSLPWEILAINTLFLCDDIRPFEVIRQIGEPLTDLPVQAKYKDLTLAFMAAYPNINGQLQYEEEEWAILKATQELKNLNIIVDDSGNLDHLTTCLIDAEHCDVAHISCHGRIDSKQGFVLQLENNKFGLQKVTAIDFAPLAKVVNCLFISACDSAELMDNKAICLSLANMGVANIVGWGGSVVGNDASEFTYHFYKVLQAGATVPNACAVARQALLKSNRPHWHLGRSYLSPTGGQPLVAKGLPKSPKWRGRACYELLDTLKNEVRVASRMTFVGRRLQTKQVLQAFDTNEKAGVLLYGMGGTGKSSLAARIMDRLEPHYESVVLYRHYDALTILGSLEHERGCSHVFAEAIGEVKKNPQHLLTVLIDLLETTFVEKPIVLIMDALEQYILEPLNKDQEKVLVKKEHQAILLAIIEAFDTANTPSRLLLTSRYPFTLLNQYRDDMSERLEIVKVPDMAQVEQYKHWIALLQTDSKTNARNDDTEYLARIFQVCRGNPGLQDILFAPLLAGERSTLAIALKKIEAYQLNTPLQNGQHAIELSLKRVALETYSDALNESERSLLQIMTLFSVPVPKMLFVKAGVQLGIDDPIKALKRLGDFGLLNYFQGVGLENHISCYSLAIKFVDPLSADARLLITKVCTPLLWHLWFKYFLDEYQIHETGTLLESITNLLNSPFSSDYKDILPLGDELNQKRIDFLNRLCLENAAIDWTTLEIKPRAFINLLELSLSLRTFEKLRVGAYALDQLPLFQVSRLYKVFENERVVFKITATEHPSAIISLLLSSLKGRTELLKQGYQQYFEGLDHATIDPFDNTDSNDQETEYKAAIKLAINSQKKAQALGNYANFLVYQKKDNEQAEKIYQRAIEADPNRAHTLGNYASFLAYQKKDEEQAEVMYQRAIEADPTHANNLGNYALFLKNQKKDDEQAEKTYQRAIEADPEDADHLGNYAYFLAYQKKDDEQAEKMYQRAIKADPTHANNLGNYANFLKNQKKDDEQAEKMYQRAIEADPNSAIKLGNYANFLANQKKDDAQAEKIYQRAIEADPNSAIKLGNYANFLAYQKKDNEQAETMYERAIEADPTHANNLGNYANFLKNQKKDSEQVKKMYQRAIEADPNSAIKLGNYANFLAYQKKDDEQAETMYQRAIEADSTHANNLGNYANFLVYQKKDDEQAEMMYQRAIEADPIHANNLGNYANFLKNQKKDDEQVDKMYQRAIEADPNSAIKLVNYANFLKNQKKDDMQAEKMYQRAIEADPNSAIKIGNYAQFHNLSKKDDEQAEKT